MNCAQCQSANSDNLTYCFKCGARLNKKFRTNPLPVPPVPNENLKTGIATASLIIGIVGFFTFGIFLVGTLVGLGLGIVAVSKNSNQPHIYGGRGRAVAGIVTNILGVFLIPIVGIIAAIAIPSLLAARKAANEAGAIGNIRTLSRAEEDYLRDNGRVGTLAELVSDRRLDSWWIDKHMDGYNYELRTDKDSFEAVATPDNYPASGYRSFYTTSRDGCRIHYGDHRGSNADEDDPVMGRPVSDTR